MKDSMFLTILYVFVILVALAVFQFEYQARKQQKRNLESIKQYAKGIKTHATKKENDC